MNSARARTRSVAVRQTLGLTFEGKRCAGEQFIQADCPIRCALPKSRSYLFTNFAYRVLA